MSVSLVTIAVGLTRLWTRLYTCRLPDDLRNARRAEIESECERFPVDVRLQVSEVQRQLHAARGGLTAHESTLREAQRNRAVLDSRRQQRDKYQRRK